MAKYKIFVEKPNKTFIFNTNNYEILENGLIKFLDIKTNKFKTFDLRVCEIEEETLKNGSRY